MDFLDTQHIQLTHNEQLVLTITTDTPIFTALSIKDARIQAFHQHITDRWLARWNSTLYKRASHTLENCECNDLYFQPWQAQLTVDITYHGSHYISIVTRASELGESRLPYLSQTSQTWKLADSSLMKWTDFIPCSKKQLALDVTRQVELQQRMEGSLLSPSAPELAEKYFNSDDFYITQDELCIYYPMNLLGPVIEGIPTFKLPIHYI